MESPLQVLPLLSTLVSSIPSMVVDGVLIALAVSRWNRHPRASLFAASAGGFLLMLDVIGRLAMTWLPMRMQARGNDLTSMTTTLVVVSGVTTVLHAVAMGLVVAAVFADRPR
jgi:hypothetical protein